MYLLNLRFSLFSGAMGAYHRGNREIYKNSPYVKQPHVFSPAAAPHSNFSFLFYHYFARGWLPLPIFIYENFSASLCNQSWNANTLIRNNISNFTFIQSLFLNLLPLFPNWIADTFYLVKFFPPLSLPFLSFLSLLAFGIRFWHLPFFSPSVSTSISYGMHWVAGKSLFPKKRSKERKKYCFILLSMNFGGM